MASEYDTLIDEIFNQTGRRLENPMEPAISMVDVEAGIDTPLEGERLENFAAAAEKLGIQGAATSEVRERVAKRIRETVQESAEISQRATFFGQVGGFAGSMAATIADPPIAMSMLVGAPMSAGILRTALIEGVAGAASEAIIQPQVQGFRAEVGLDAGVTEALARIGMAGLGGAVFGGGLKALGRGTSFLVEKARANARADQSAIDAWRYSERVANAEDSTPFFDSRLADREHLERLNIAETTLRDGDISAKMQRPLSVLNPEVRFQRLSRDAVQAVSEEQPLAGPAFEAMQRLREDILKDEFAEEALRAKKFTAQALLDQPALGEMLKLASKALKRPRGARSLTDFMRTVGGLKDPKGELKALGITGRTRPGAINRQTGRDLDTFGELAAEAGYFLERPSVPELLDALGEDFRGTKKRFATQEEAQEILDFDAQQQGQREIQRLLDDLGIDPRRVNERDLRLALDEFVKTPVMRRAPEEGAMINEERAVLNAANLEDDISDEVLATREADMRARYGLVDDAEQLTDQPIRDPDDAVYLDDTDFITEKPASAREIMDDLADDEAFLKEWDACVTGGTVET